MKKYYIKVFFSKHKECQWLNSMGEKGFLLKKIKDSKYYFTKNDKNTYSYSIEYFTEPLQSEDSLKYLTSLEEKGIVPIISSGSWYYFCATNKKIPPSHDIYVKNSQFYFWRTLYLLFFSCFSAILCGYHAFAAEFIIKAGHTGQGRIPLFTISDNSFVDSLLDILNKLFELLNNTYVKIFTNIFGQNDAALTLSFLVPITIILTVYFALYLHEYFFYRTFIKGRRGIRNAK